MAYGGIWGWLYDWQTLIAGVLALCAGGAAYNIGRKQVRAVEEQNNDMKERERRALARKSGISASLFGSILKTVIKNIEENVERVDRDWHPEPFNKTWRPRENLISPPLYQVLNHLGELDVDLIETYFVLHAKVEQFRSETIVAREDMIRELREILIIASDLCKKIEMRHG